MKEFLNLIQSWLPVLTVVGGALWGLFTYVDHQKEMAGQAAQQENKQTAARLLEAQRPFLEKQLALYFETAQVAGKLVTLKPGSTEWDNNETRFWQLYWSELSMVESQDIESAMVKVGQNLTDYKNAPIREENRRTLDVSVYELAHAIRNGIKTTWTSKAD
jgi:hypothetical protein